MYSTHFVQSVRFVRPESTVAHTHTRARAHEHAQNLSQSPAATEGMRQTNTPLSKFSKPTLQIRVGGGGGWGVNISVSPSMLHFEKTYNIVLKQVKQVKTPVHNLQSKSNYIPTLQLTVMYCLVR